jgi:hypothetical protein
MMRWSNSKKMAAAAVCGAVMAPWWATRVNADEAAPHARRACAASYEKAQVQREAWKLRNARASFLACARPVCGKFIYQECTKSLAQIDADIPSVVFTAKDDRGEPVVDVQVTMDGERLTSHLDGRSMSIDPGIHHFSFRAVNGVADLARVPIAQGERNRSLSVELRASSAQPRDGDEERTVVAARARTRAAPQGAPSPITADVAASAPRAAVATPRPVLTHSAALPVAEGDAQRAEPARKESSNLAPYLVGSAGLAGVAGFGILYALARNENKTLGECWPNCSETKLDGIRRLYLAADISLGVGVAALGAATWLFLSHPAGENPAPRTPRYVVGVAPERSGFYATVSGQF